jgi:hypothetical protein
LEFAVYENNKIVHPIVEVGQTLFSASTTSVVVEKNLINVAADA